MRPTAALSALALLATAACGGSDDDDSDPTPTGPNNNPLTARVEASATANTFTPATVAIAPGGTVTFAFGARAHNVSFTAPPAAVADVPNTTSAEVARVFTARGAYPYTCTLHAGMSGTVTVQ